MSTPKQIETGARKARIAYERAMDNGAEHTRAYAEAELAALIASATPRQLADARTAAVDAAQAYMPISDGDQE